METHTTSLSSQQEKQYIIQAALTLFRQHGIRQVSVDRLTKEIHISRRKLYSLFGDKKRLLVACLDQHYAEERQQGIELRKACKDEISFILEAAKVVLDRELHTNANFFYDLLHYYPDLRASSIQKNQSFNIVQLQEAISSGQAAQLFRADLHPLLVSNVIITFYESLLQKELYLQFSHDPRRFVYLAIEPYLRGLCTDAGIQRLEYYSKEFDYQNDGDKIEK